MTTWLRYHNKPIVAEMIAWTPGFDMAGVSVSDVDKAAGCPKDGDMIRRNPDDHNDRWLVNAAFFKKNFDDVPMMPDNLATMAGGQDDPIARQLRDPKGLG